jgi:exodeoxyribonuclease V alpha subunit
MSNFQQKKFLETIGQIVGEDKKKNNVYYYTIKNKNGISEKFIKFDGPLDIKYNIYNFKITYEEKNNSTFGNQKIIKNIQPVDVITNIDFIRYFLTRKLHITKPAVDKIIEEFKEKSLEILLEKPNEIDNIPNIQQRTKDKIKNLFIENETINVFIEFDKLDIPKDKQNILIKTLGLNNINKLNEYFSKSKLVYALCNKQKCNTKCEKKCTIHSAILNFPICDNIAKEYKYFDKDNDIRLNAFIKYIFDIVERNGDLYIPKYTLVEYCDRHDVNIFKIFSKIKRIIVDDNKYYTSNDLFDLEKDTEKILIDCLESKMIKSNKDPSLENNLSDEQKKSVLRAINNNISIISGPPGSGKTTIIKSLINNLNTSMTFILAPTGTAGERIKKDIATNDWFIEIYTLHSFLYKIIKNITSTDYIKKITIGTYGITDFSVLSEKDIKKCDFNKNGKDIIHFRNGYDDLYASTNIDSITIIIDEMSMVGLRLFNEFLNAMVSRNIKFKLVLIGDVNQLPSIDAGNMLYDLIECNKFKTTILKKVYRQDDGLLKDSAYNILTGKSIKFDDNSIIHINIDDTSKIISKLNNILSEHNIKHENSAILIPVNTGEYGVNNINKELQKYYNPTTTDNPILFRTAKYEFKINDKLINITNDYDKDIYNGTILYLIESQIDDNGDEDLIQDTINKKELIYKCKNTNNNNIISLTKEDFNNINLAYAMTIHKSQGKEYDTVIIIMTSSMHKMLSINLLYTAVTRAKKKCIIICDKNALTECKKTMNLRITNFFK